MFVHLLPDVAEAQEALGASAGTLPYLERHAYLVALAGVAVFYGLERAAQRSRGARRAAEERDRTTPAVFWVHIGSYAAYNALVGYLVAQRSDDGARSLAVFAFALSVHFLVNDRGLHEHHKDGYARFGRFLLAAAPLAGWIVGVTADVGEEAHAALLAFLAGAIILNVLKEELPYDRASRFLPFAAAAAAYAALLLAL